MGKVIHFETLYSISSTNREYGRITIPNGPSFPEQVVAAGWAKIRDDAGRNEQSEGTVAGLEKLRSLESTAKQLAIGIWSTEGGRIEVAQDVGDAAAFVAEKKDKHLDGIIEKALTGDRLIIRLLVDPLKHIQTIVLLAGIRAPSTRRTSPDGKDIPAEPCGTEAQQFVEERLLQRKCAVRLLGVTPQNQLVAAVMHPKGNIAKFLLEAGLARCNDQHVTMLGNEIATFRETEKKARDSRKGVFAGQANTSTRKSGPEADYTVVRIQTADTIFLRPRSGPEKKMGLSSIRQPKPTDTKQAPFSADAKEFVRKKLIGKHVKVRVDGKKPASEGYEEREVATITLHGQNVALMIVEAGYASVIRHRRDDDDRSSDYDALLLAEETAQKEGKGMWSSKPSDNVQYQDYSVSLQKAKLEASVLQRQKRVPAIVDFVKSASRLVVLVPRERAKLTFVLSGIRAPKSARNADEKSEPFGQEAHDFANRRCMQRDVEINVENIDKVGGFIGTLFVNRENFAKLLVEEGLAEVHGYSAEQSGSGRELFAAEERAKEAKRGMWHDWDPSKDDQHSSAMPGKSNDTNGIDATAATATTGTTSKAKDYRDVLVTHVDPETGHLKLQEIGSNTTGALTELMNAFRSLHLSPAKHNLAPISSAPRVGDILAGQFSMDKEWYRARVRRVDREAKTAEVIYIDYGNTETVSWTNLRPLTQPSQFGVQKLKPQAIDAVLSYVQLPPATTSSSQYLHDCVNYLTQITDGRELVASVDYIESSSSNTPNGTSTDSNTIRSSSTGGTLHVTLLDPSNSNSLEESINADVVREGLATVSEKKQQQQQEGRTTRPNMNPDVGQKWRDLQEEAKKERRGMWEYGDLTDD